MNDREPDDYIARSQAEWQATIDAVGDYLFVIDAEFRIRRLNRSFAARYGKHPRDLVGRDVREVLEFELPVPACGAHEGHGDAAGFRQEVRMADEVYALSAFPARYGDDRVCVFVMKDITEIVNLRSKLYHSYRIASLGRLVSGVAHEINNPLTAILGFSEMLRAKAAGGAFSKEIERIYTSAMRCKEVVEDLMSFARQQPPRKSREDINEVISHTLELRAYWFRKNQIRLVKDFGSIPALMLDRQQIQQVILNILINAEQAIEASGRQGEITVTTRLGRAGSRAVISVADNGCGIREEHLNRILDPFFTTKPVSQGTGLGLAISHGFVAEHGGSIRAESKEGSGTTVIVELPVK